MLPCTWPAFAAAWNATAAAAADRQTDRQQADGKPDTLMSFVMERMRRRDSSESRIMPSILLYSSSETYAPISAIDLTCSRDSRLARGRPVMLQRSA